MPGGRLSGELVLDPVEDWSFSDEHSLIQVETRPGFPHSVTTICLSVDGKLYIPASNPTRKQWPFFVLEDPHVRVKMGDKLYPGLARRVVPDQAFLDTMLEAASKKYPQLAEQDRDELPELWMFRIDPLG
jgi:hypothetical protein